MSKLNKVVTKQKRKSTRKKKLNKVNLESYFSTKECDHHEYNEIKDLAVEVLLDVSPQGITEIRNKCDEYDTNECKDTPSSVADISSPVGYLKMSPYSNSRKTTTRKRNVKCNASKSRSIKTEICGNFLQATTGSTGNTSPVLQAASISEKCKKSSKLRKQDDSQKITEFFPIRRSSRKTKSIIKKEKEDFLIDAILSNREEHMEIVEFTSKGRGIIATKNFTQGDFVVEYAGDLLSWPEAKQRELEYSMDSRVGCYMYYFHARQQNYCIDATAESGRLGRLLNHSRRSPNCYTRLVWVPDLKSSKEKPHLVILAKRNIEKNEELTYDYGDRDKSAVEVHPWLKL